MLIFTEEIEIERGVTYKHTFYLMDNEGAVINTSAYKPMLVLKNTRSRYPEKIDMTAYLDAHTLANNGIVLLDIPWDVTRKMALGSGLFELQVYNLGAKEMYKIAEGKYRVRSAFMSGAMPMTATTTGAGPAGGQTSGSAPAIIDGGDSNG